MENSKVECARCHPGKYVKRLLAWFFHFTQPSLAMLQGLQAISKFPVECQNQTQTHPLQARDIRILDVDRVPAILSPSNYERRGGVELGQEGMAGVEDPGSGPGAKPASQDEEWKGEEEGGPSFGAQAHGGFGGPAEVGLSHPATLSLYSDSVSILKSFRVAFGRVSCLIPSLCDLAANRLDIRTGRRSYWVTSQLVLPSHGWSTQCTKYIESSCILVEAIQVESRL